MEENDENDDYVDPEVEAAKKKKEFFKQVFDFLTLGPFTITFILTLWFIFFVQGPPILFDVFLTFLWLNVWLVMWIDKFIVRGRFRLKKFIKLIYYLIRKTISETKKLNRRIKWFLEDPKIFLKEEVIPFLKINFKKFLSLKLIKKFFSSKWIKWIKKLIPARFTKKKRINLKRKQIRSLKKKFIDTIDSIEKSKIFFIKLLFILREKKDI